MPKKKKKKGRMDEMDEMGYPGYDHQLPYLMELNPGEICDNDSLGHPFHQRLILKLSK